MHQGSAFNVCAGHVCQCVCVCVYGMTTYALVLVHVSEPTFYLHVSKCSSPEPAKVAAAVSEAGDVHGDGDGDVAEAIAGAIDLPCTRKWGTKSAA